MTYAVEWSRQSARALAIDLPETVAAACLEFILGKCLRLNTVALLIATPILLFMILPDTARKVYNDVLSSRRCHAVGQA